MSTPFLSEIRIFSFNFAPRGWAQCGGQLLPINQNQALFALLGTTYGGNGQTTFALPDLRGRTPNGVGPGFDQGQRAGAENITLVSAQIPGHSHAARALSAVGTSSNPTGQIWAATNAASNPKYAPGGSPPAAMAPSALANAGGNQPHPNMQPYLVVNFCIALQGIFPSRN